MFSFSKKLRQWYGGKLEEYAHEAKEKNKEINMVKNKKGIEIQVLSSVYEYTRFLVE